MEENDFEELSKLAFLRKELSDFAPLPTKYMYLRLCDLYSAFAKGKISKEKSIEIKNKLKNEYLGLLKEQERDMECYKEYLSNRKENTGMLIQLEKSNNKDEMLDICLKIIANCVHDKDLYNRNAKKLENQ